MRMLGASLLTFALATPCWAQSTAARPNAAVEADANIQAVSPALDRYSRETIMGDLWQRPQLAPRDRSVVTLAVLISRKDVTELPAQFRRALDNGVTPAEISEIITHLAFYSGFGDATAAAGLAREAFAERGIGPEQLPPASPQLLPIDQAAEARRAATVQQTVGPISPGLVQFTGEVLFNDLWLRPGLAPRDRSLVTVASLITNGHVAQMPFHLNRAMDNGLTQEQAGEVITQVAFYGGWPNAFSAVPVAAEVFRNRAR